MILEEFERTILVQYANANRLLYLLRGMNNTIDPRVDIDNIFREELDLDTCGTHGLDVWGIIVAAPRTVIIDDEDYFGYQGTGFMPFNNDRFYTGKLRGTVYRLENEAYRRMIYFKAMANIMKTTIPNINTALKAFFADRPENEIAYVQQTDVMHMRIVFGFNLTPVERAIFRTYGYLLRSAGVGIRFIEIPFDTFGFMGSELQPFNQGTFYAGNIQ